MSGQFGVQRFLRHQQLGQLLEQAVLANQVFRLLVVGQQARQQFFGYIVFLGADGQTGLCRRWIVRLHKILHTLVIGKLARSHLPHRLQLEFMRVLRTHLLLA